MKFSDIPILINKWMPRNEIRFEYLGDPRVHKIINLGTIGEKNVTQYYCQYCGMIKGFGSGICPRTYGNKHVFKEIAMNDKPFENDESTGRRQAEYNAQYTKNQKARLHADAAKDNWQAANEEYTNGMGRERYGSPHFYKLLEKAAETHDKKSHDYASNDNPFGNYEFAGMLSKLFNNPDDAGFIGRIGEKIYRLANLENSNQIALNESIEDTETDIFVITGLWMAARQEKRNKHRNYLNSLVGGTAGGGKSENLRKQAEKDLDQVLDEQPSFQPSQILHDYRLHRELTEIFNRYGVDSALGAADHTITLKVVSDLMKWKAQIS